MNSDDNILGRSDRLASRKRYTGGLSFLDNESLRITISVLLSMVVVIAAIKIPWQERSAGVSWRSIGDGEVINFVPPPEEIIEPDDIEGGVITLFDEAPPEEEEKTEIEEEPEELQGEDLEEEESEDLLSRMDRIELSPVLEFVDQSPSIIGGLSSLYLNIDYPIEARDKGIQGLTVLMFIVEKDGSTSNIEVMKSLHPACDSAAVIAVRQTRFNPGVQDGEEVRVKMRLPIRFKLVNRNERYTAPDSTGNPSR